MSACSRTDLGLHAMIILVRTLSQLRCCSTTSPGFGGLESRFPSVSVSSLVDGDDGAELIACLKSLSYLDIHVFLGLSPCQALK